ncbi:MAG: hypothetical protein KGZ83_14380 [Sulfuricella sp.]|nr:hypothetical protein [Sulfuricella sp.]
MKILLSLILAFFPLVAAASVNTYSPGDGRLFVKNVSIDGAIFSNLTLTLRNDGSWTVDAATPGVDSNGAEHPFVSFDSNTGIATFPALDINGSTLQNVTVTLNSDGGWEMSLARATPLPTSPASAIDYNGLWVNEPKGLKYMLNVVGNSLTLTNVRTGLIFQGTLDGGVVSLVEDDAYLLQFATLTLSPTAATLRIESCQPKNQGYFCSRTLPVKTPVTLYKQ